MDAVDIPETNDPPSTVKSEVETAAPITTPVVKVDTPIKLETPVTV